MQFVAKAKYIWYSPYKLRPLVDVIRGKDVGHAVGWLSTYGTKKSVSIKKLIESAAANAKSLNNLDAGSLLIKEIRVDQGPIYKYFRPGAQGRAMPQRKRLCHISVTLEPKNLKNNSSEDTETISRRA